MEPWGLHLVPHGWFGGRVVRSNEPAPTVLASGFGSYGYWIEGGGSDERPVDVTKPPYKVADTAEVMAVPSNGMKAISLFAGAGGSCLGYRMAGFDVVWASEFEPNAGDCHHANFSDAILDRRDVRDVQPAEVLTALDLGVGELDVMDGSPPCQSFSTAGVRQAGWGKSMAHADGTTQRSDDLFFEYVRLLDGIQPRAFVAENVSGLVKGVAKGYFIEILRALKKCGYRVEARVLDAQWLGVPQMRKRVIFMGVRNDLERSPAFPAPLPYRYSIRNALPWLSAVRYDTSGEFTKRDLNVDTEPVGTITISGGAAPSDPSTFQCQGAAPPEMDDASGTNGYAGLPSELRLPPSRERGYDGSPAYNFSVADADAPAPTITVASPGNDLGHPHEKRKFTIAELRRLCSFPDDYVLLGTYSQQWARLGNSVPPLMMKAVADVLRDRVLGP